MSSKKEPNGDERFARVNKDPRFWEMPDVDRRVRIDKRFQSMFHDERFKLKYTVDKRGRPVNHTSTEDLKRFYKLSDSEQSDGGKDSQQEEKKKKKKKKKKPEAKEGVEEPQFEDGQGKEEEPEEEAEHASEKVLMKHKRASERKDFVKTHKATTAEQAGVGDVEGKDDDLESDSDEEEDRDTDEGARLVADDEDLGDEDDGEQEEEEEEDEDESDRDSGPDLARGKGNIETSSEEEDGGGDDDDDEVVEDYLRREEEELEHDWGEMWKDAPRSEETSRRLAVCNMDWDRIKAKDLLALFSSFKPKGGVVLSVTIYPSEFGKERMDAEQTRGPLELTSLPDDPDADTEEQRLYREKVRDYQFKRLRYYYAVVECDSVATAVSIYEECDGFEYESSRSTLDLRFIPDEVAFEDEPKDRASEVDISTYKPRLFSSASNTTAKVELTWDETDHERVTALSRKFKKDELLDMDFRAYLASSSEEEEGGGAEEEEEEAAPAAERLAEEEKTKRGKKGRKEEEQISKYRELLQGLRDKDAKAKDQAMEMEVTWVPGLKETTEKLVKKKLEGRDKLTPWEEFLEKKKEKKKEKRKGKKEAESESDVAVSDDELPPDVDLSDPFFSEELGSTGKSKRNAKRSKKGEEQRTPEEEAELEKQKAEMALLMADDEEEGRRHFNYDKIVEQQNLSKKKRKKLLKSNTPLEEDNFQVDVQDPRFQAMFTSHLYNLDPSDPAYRKTRGTQSILQEKQRQRRSQQEALQSAHQHERTVDPSLSTLIRSVKNKTQQFQAQKKQRTK
ncbi:ESF1 homolog [Electrophorus electricus]|uniref:NUC153 domain-containing protein n=1 Tax=Electrophorus electricus TaxID=8005 RepID=A0A4W4GKH1_ELEEL|nr:ESF1 homolog [Electrophorus electricus]XP_026869578.2 ESF1 homolog [Electrophorus electricus]XP_026869580.2 ESF1 homolog [Electrophorus electricus]XP_026869581.2 ESF1 homolog [Electrophorus electricus]